MSPAQIFFEDMMKTIVETMSEHNDHLDYGEPCHKCIARRIRILRGLEV